MAAKNLSIVASSEGEAREAKDIRDVLELKVGRLLTLLNVGIASQWDETPELVSDYMGVCYDIAAECSGLLRELSDAGAANG
jgi:hypothetical protein